MEHSEMPSQRHESLLALFRNDPALAPELLRASLHVKLPEYTELRIDSENLSDIQPAEYRADLVLLLLKAKPVLGIVIEVQLTPDEDKHYAWPAYVTNLRARIRCPVCLLVMAAQDRVARWASRPIELGGGNRFVPYALGPSGIPHVIDKEKAKEHPELAVLSAVAHGGDVDLSKSLPIALAAMTASIGLDADRSTLYFDLVLNSLTEAARRALQAMDPAKYEYQSEFAKRYFTEGKVKGKEEGKAEGKAEGRTERVLELLILRYGTLPEAIHERLQSMDPAQLDVIFKRALEVSTLEEALRA